MSDLSLPAGAPHWALPPGWLLYNDGEVLAVSKPPGVSISAPERGSKDDLTARVRWLLEHEGNPAAYLCAHMHLDRDTSGVVVFASHRDVNRSLSQPGAIDVEYVVAVRCDDTMAQAGVVSGEVHKARDGMVQPGKGQRAELRYEILRRRGDRALLSVSIERGARAIRALLAGRGWPVAGDAALGGPAASRLLVHAASARVRHPRSGQVLTIDASAPWQFEAWLQGLRGPASLEPAALASAIHEAATMRFGLIAEQQITAFRLLHGEGEGLEGLDVEWHAGHAVVWVHEDTPNDVVERIVGALDRLRPEGTYVKVRPKQASRIVHAKSADLITPHATRGRDAPQELIVRENDLRFVVRLAEGLGTGLFLDQRANRAWLMARCRGRTVLNLFAYTCAFTVAAAAGGAKSTVSVDISRKSLEGGARNLAANDMDPSAHVLVCDDVSAWVEQAQREGRRFDFIILDPPSFGTSHRGRFSATRDFVALTASCFKLLNEGGTLLACTNHRGVPNRKLRGWLRSAAERAACSVELRDAPPAADFPHPPGEEPHMKAVICSVGARLPAHRTKREGGGGRSTADRRTTTGKGRSSRNRGGRR